MERPGGGRGRRWTGVVGGLVAAAVGLGAPVLLCVVPAVLLLGALQFEGCEIDLAEDRHDCAESERELVAATTVTGAGAVERRLAEGDDPDAPDEEGNRPLACAALVGNADAVDALLAAGADPEQRGQVGGRPLVAAVSGEGRAGNDPSDGDVVFSPRGSPARHRIVRALVARGVAPDPGLAPAIEQGDREMTRLLWELGASLDGPADQPSPLMTAIWAGQPEIAVLLLELGADPDNGGTVGSADAVLALLAISADLPEERTEVLQGTVGAPGEGDVPPLAAAIVLGSRSGTDLVPVLLDAGADPDLPAFGRFTLAWVAVLVQDREAVLRLRAAGADPHAAPAGGESAAALALRLGDEEMLRLLTG